MDNINEITRLFRYYTRDSENYYSNISSLENQIEVKKDNLLLASNLKNSIIKNEKKVILEFVYSIIIISVILYLIF